MNIKHQKKDTEKVNKMYTKEQIQSMRSGEEAKYLKGKTFYKMMFTKNGEGLELLTYTPKKNLHRYPGESIYHYYSIEEDYKANAITNEEDREFCSKYIEDGYWFTPEKAIKTWIAWKDHFLNQDPLTYGAKYQEAFESEDFQIIRDEYPQLFI